METCRIDFKGELLCSSVSGLVKALIIQPFDFIRIRIQTSLIKSNKINQIISNLVKEEGLRILFKGQSITLLSVLTTNTIQLTFFQRFHSVYTQMMYKRKIDSADAKKKHITIKERVLVSGLSGISSGTLMSFFTTPLDNIRIRIQSSENKKKGYKKQYRYNDPLQCLRFIIINKGVSALYTAFPVCFLRETMGSFIYFSVFEMLKNLNNPERKALKLHVLFIYGGVSGMTNWLITLPVDFVKTKMISDTINSNKKFNGIIDCLKKTYIHYGIQGFYRGLSVVLFRAGFVNGIFLATFEKCKIILQNTNKNKCN